ncbi:MAG: uncharacterized protein KVP18_002639 [Porospora cf. gigantea A]|nr:MAG: hypothetical protein KVP18_002639 [Porospora cf. gigantea A]
MLCTRSSRVRLQKLTSIESKDLRHRFDTRTHKSLRLPCWIELKKGQDTVQAVAKRGLVVSDSGLRVSFGNVHVTEDGESDVRQLREGMGAHPVQLKLILCSVGVGPMQPVSSYEEAELRLGSQSPMIESFYVQNTPEFPVLITSSDGELKILPDCVFRNDYLVFDASQILSRYYVEAIYEPVDAEHFAVSLCANCNESRADLWCEADQSLLCRECDGLVHCNRIAAIHRRIPVHESVTAKGRCRMHPERDNSLYCVLCEVACCQECLGAHKHDGDETLVSLEETYREAVAASLENYPVIEARKAHIASLLAAVDSAIRQTENEARDSLTSIDQARHNAEEQVESRVREEMVSVLSAETLIERRHDLLSHHHEYMNYVKRTESPGDFMRLWLLDQQLQKEEECQHEGLNLAMAELGSTMQPLTVTSNLKLHTT